MIHRTLKAKSLLVSLATFASSSTLMGSSAQNIRIEHVQGGQKVHVLQERFSSDRAYVLKLQQTLLNLEREIDAEVSKLQEFADRSLHGAVAISEFLKTSRDFEEAVRACQNELEVYQALPLVQSNGMSREVGDGIDFAALETMYRRKIDAKRNLVTALHFRIDLGSERIVEHQGIDLKPLQSMNLYTSEQIIEMRKREARLRMMRSEDRDGIDQSINLFTLQKIRAFISAFGESQRYRTQTNLEARDQAVRELEEAFWIRSYLRAVYGIKLGSFSIDYDKRAFRWDTFGPAHLKFTNRFITDENDLMKKADLVYAALEAQTGKNQLILAYETPMFSRIASLLSYFSGEHQEVEANIFVLSLLGADNAEERILGRASGLKGMRAHYRSRYYANDADRDFYKAAEKRYLGGNSAMPEVEDDLGTVSTDTLAGTVAACKVFLGNHELRLNDANNLRDTIAKLTAGNVMVRNREARTEL